MHFKIRIWFDACNVSCSTELLSRMHEVMCRAICVVGVWFHGYASVNSSCAHPLPPGQLQGICVPCQSQGWGISKFGTARGSGICLPPGFWHTHVVSDSKSKHGGFYRKGPALRRRLDRPLRTGQACGGFLDFMHFFIGYQGTTITLYSEIGNDPRESTHACFFEQGFKQNLVAMILKLLRSIIEF